IGGAEFASSEPSAAGDAANSCFDPASFKGMSSGSNEVPFSSLFINGDLRTIYSGRPAHDHAAQRIPPVGDDQSQVRHNKEKEEPHEPEMPHTSSIKASKE